MFKITQNCGSDVLNQIRTNQYHNSWAPLNRSNSNTSDEECTEFELRSTDWERSGQQR